VAQRSGAMSGRSMLLYFNPPATPAGQGRVAAAALTRCYTPCVRCYEPSFTNYKDTNCRTGPSSRLLGIANFYE